MDTLTKEVKVKKSTCERYDLRWNNKSCWAVILLDERGGVLSIQSDYGDYNHCWPHHGRESFKHFLLETDQSYLLGKFVGHPDQIDFDRTINEWKLRVIEMRMDRNLNSGHYYYFDYDDSWSDPHDHSRISAETARELYDRFSRLDDAGSTDWLVRDIFDDEFLSEFFGHDFHSVTVHMRYNGQVEGFFREIWPEFINALKEEICVQQ